MQFRFITIPVFNYGDAQEALNKFLRSRRVISVQKEFVSQGEKSFWALAVEYIEHEILTSQAHGKIKARVDYRELLAEKDFLFYTRLRELRKRIADEEAIPVYAVFTNEQLAAMVQQKIATKADMGKIEGIGDVKIEKYADRFLPLLKEYHETNKQPD